MLCLNANSNTQRSVFFNGHRRSFVRTLAGGEVFFLARRTSGFCLRGHLKVHTLFIFSLLRLLSCVCRMNSGGGGREAADMEKLLLFICVETEC